MKCGNCNTELIDAPAIGLYCSNPKCPVIDGPFMVKVEPLTINQQSTGGSMYEKKDMTKKKKAKKGFPMKGKKNEGKSNTNFPADRT